MVRVNLQIGTQELFARRPAASAWLLDGHKDHIEASQCFGIVAPQYPPFMGVVLIEQSQAHRRWPITTASPDLERYVACTARLAIEVKPVKDQRTVFGIKDAPELLCGFSVLGC